MFNHRTNEFSYQAGIALRWSDATCLRGYNPEAKNMPNRIGQAKTSRSF